MDQRLRTSEATVSNKSGDGLGSLLVIEDALVQSTIISRLGEKIGFSTTTAGSYIEAAMLLQERVFDCITLDLGLGNHCGEEILHLLSVISCKVPILIVSGSEPAVCDEAVKVGKSLGLNIYEPVQKPIDHKVLRKTLAEIKQSL
jgi:two-component system, chemotaxis family, chemotaxis protein CheY